MVETLDLQDEIGSLGATNIEVPPPKPELAPEPARDPPKKEPEKNINTNKSTPMDSTPINELMMEPQPDMQAPIQMPPQVAAVQPQPQPQAAPSMMKSKNFMNLTDEQMDALVAAVASMIAFSGPAQERLAAFVPNFSGESGLSTTGLIVSGLVVAILYFFARRYVVKA